MKQCNHKSRNEKTGRCAYCVRRARFADPAYRNNKVCRKGHKGYNTSGQCIECTRIRDDKKNKKMSKMIRKIRKLQALLNPPEPSTPCKKYGHTGGRYDDGRCKECQRIASKNRHKMLKENKDMRDALPPCQRCGKKDRNEYGQCKKCHNESVRVSESNRRALAMGASGTLTVDGWERVKKSANGRCRSCGKKRALTIDHIVPLSWGGSNHISNIQAICLSCNSIKHQDDTNFMK